MLFALFFLIFLGFGFWNIRSRRVAQHREWMIRAFGVALGIATTRPIVSAFFAVGRLKPHEFFGTAFWLGFSLTLLGAEVWIQTSRTYSMRTGLTDRGQVSVHVSKSELFLAGCHDWANLYVPRPERISKASRSRRHGTD